MIPIELYDEPDSFDAAVRRPGQRAIAELLGLPSPPRRGRRRADIPGRANLKAEHLTSYWTACIPELREAYHHICAYLAIYIYPGTGTPTVDHACSKNACVKEARAATSDTAAISALYPVYEWTNYRLSSSTMNSRKGDASDVLDPASIEDGWFIIEFAEMRVAPGEGLTPSQRQQVEATIKRLSLNDSECRRARASDFNAYLNNEVSFTFLDRRSPFVAREARRQGLLRAEEE